MIKTLVTTLLSVLCLGSSLYCQSIRYWVPGGTGNWASTTNWSTSSGGSSGASLPGSTDIVIIDQNSGTSANVVISLGATSRSISLLSIIGANVTFTGSSGTVNLTVGNGLSGNDLLIENATVTINNSSGVGINLVLADNNQGLVNNAQIVVSANSFSNAGPSSNLVFSGNASYVHNINSGSLPLATWQGNSVCSITGITSISYTQSTTNQVFNHFVWNCPNQATGTRSAFGAGQNSTVLGYFRVENTNGQVLLLSNGGTNTNISINNLSITGGIVRLGGGIVNLSVSGDVFVGAGATFDLQSNNDANFFLIGSDSEIDIKGTLTRSANEPNFIVAKNDNNTKLLLRSDLDLSPVNGHDLLLRSGIIQLNGYNFIYRMPSFQLSSIHHTAIITSTSALSSITVIGNDMGGSGLGTLAGVYGLLNKYQISNPENDNYYFTGDVTILGILNLTGNTNSNFYVLNNNKITFNNVQLRSSWYEAIQTSNKANLGVGPFGVYVHDINGGTLPDLIWHTESTLSITGTATSSFTPLSNPESFYNVVIDIPSNTLNTAGMSNAATWTVQNNFIVKNTGSGSFVINQNGGGAQFHNVSISGGILRCNQFDNCAETNITITGDFYGAANTTFVGKGGGCNNEVYLIFTGSSSQYAAHGAFQNNRGAFYIIDLKKNTDTAALIVQIPFFSNLQSDGYFTDLSGFTGQNIRFNFLKGRFDLNGNTAVIQINGSTASVQQPGSITSLGSASNLNLIIPDIASGILTTPGLRGVFNNLTLSGANDDFFLVSTATVSGEYFQKSTFSLNGFISGVNHLYLNGIWRASNRASLNLFPLSKSNLYFGTNAIYHVNIDAGVIQSKGTWLPGSTVSITGVTSNNWPGIQGLAQQDFSNVIWDCPSQIANVGATGGTVGDYFAVYGDFVLRNLNGYQFVLKNGNTSSAFINNFSILGGAFLLDNACGNATTVTITGNFHVASGATANFNVGCSGAQPVLFTGNNKNSVYIDGSVSNVSRFILVKSQIASATGLNFTKNTVLNFPIEIVKGMITTGMSDTLMVNSIIRASENTGWVYGNLAKNFSTGTSITRTFEVGTASNYNPVTITLPTVSTVGNMGVRVMGQTHPQIATAVCLNANRGVDIYWSIFTFSGSAISPVSYTPSFRYNLANLKNSSSGANQFLAGYNSEGWNYYGGVPTASDFVNNDGSILSGTTNQLGDFVLAETITASVSGSNVICSPSVDNVELTVSGLSSIQWRVPSRYTIQSGSTNDIMAFQVSTAANTGLISVSGFNPCISSTITLFYPITVNSAPALPTASGLVMHYSFSNNYNDGAGANTALPQNSPIFTIDRFGIENRAIRLNGSNQFLTNTNTVAISGDFTLSIWFRTTTNQGGYIVGRGNNQTATSTSHDRKLLMHNDGRIAFGIWNGNINYVNSSASYNDGKWHHVGIIHSNTSGIILVVDGIVVGSANFFSTDGGTGYWRIGYDDHWGISTSAYFNGEVDDFQYYNRVLSLTEIQLLQGIQINSPFCQNLELNAPQFLGALYTWSGPSGFSSFSKSSTILGINDISNSGIYVLQATNKCGSLPDLSAQVQLDRAKITGITSNCFNTPAVTFSVSGLSTYSWAMPYGYFVTSGAGTKVISATFSGSAISEAISVSGLGLCTGGTEFYTLPITINGIYTHPSLSGIVFLYNLDGNAQDASGNANHATLYNAPTFTLDRKGEIGSAVNLTNTPSNQYIITNATYASPNNFTMSLWFKTSSTSVVLAGLNSENSPDGNTTNHDRQLFINRFGQIAFRVGAVANIITSLAAYNDNNWHHAAATLSPRGIKIYVDGNLVASRSDVTSGSALTGYWRFGRAQMCCYGGLHIDANIGNFVGQMDEIGYYNRELGSDEVKYLYGLRHSLSPICSGIITLSGPDFARANGTWSGPNSFSSTNSDVTISGVSFANSGTYIYTYTNVCGSGNLIVALRTNSTQATTSTGPGQIAGSSAVCSAPFTTNYSVVGLNNTSLTGYTWRVPSSISISSGQGTSVVGLSFPASFTGIATISVSGINECGSTQQGTFQVGLDGRVWTGNTSDWSLGTNWCGGVAPTATTDAIVLFPSPNYPVISTSGVVRNLTVTGGASVTVQPDVQFQVHGNVNLGGVLSVSGVLNMQGSNQNITGSGVGYLKAMYANGSGVKFLGTPLFISSVLGLADNVQVQSGNKNLILQSLGNNASDNARILPMPSGATITGTVVASRYFDGKRATRHVSVPVSGGTAAQWKNNMYLTGPSGCIGCDASLTRVRSVQWYNEEFPGTASGGFVPLTNTGMTLIPGRGYSVFSRGARIGSVDVISPSIAGTPTVITVSGTLVQGDFSFPLSFTPAMGSASDGWNFIGNPYISPVNWSHSSITKSNFLDVLHIWDSKGTTSTGAYFTCAFDGSNWVASDLRPNCEIIDAGQGFFIQTTAAGATLIFTENAKTSYPAGYQSNFKSEVVNNALLIHVLAGNSEDKTAIFLRKNTTSLYNRNRDGIKLKTGTLQVYTQSEDGEDLALNQIYFNEKDTLEIPIKIATSSTGNLTMQLSNIQSFDKDIEVYLIHTQSKVQTKLSQDMAFMLYKPTAEVLENYAIQFIRTKSSETLNPSVGDINVPTYQILQKSDTLLTATYLTNGNMYNIQIFPNPTSGDAIHVVFEPVVQMSNFQATCSLINLNGDEIFTSYFKENQGKYVTSLDVLQYLPSGIYTIKIFWAGQVYYYKVAKL